MHTGLEKRRQTMNATQTESTVSPAASIAARPAASVVTRPPARLQGQDLAAARSLPCACKPVANIRTRLLMQQAQQARRAGGAALQGCCWQG